MLRSLAKVALRQRQRIACPPLAATGNTLVGASVQPDEGTGVRHFSRRSRDELAEQEEELLRASAENYNNSEPSAVDMEFYSQVASDFEDDDDEDEDAKLAAEYRRKQEEIQKELDSRTGREWTDPWAIKPEQWASSQTFDELPEWSPEYVSRISQERVKLHPDGIPSLAALATMPLPAQASPHPTLGKAKTYAAYRKKTHSEYVAGLVANAAPARLERILKLTSWEEKQDAVDELYEGIENELREKEEILGKHPEFGKWVSKAIEDILTKVQSGGMESITAEAVSKTVDPVFMDCFESGNEDEIVPPVLSPLKPHPKDGPGKMVEEWELAANKNTKRILIRECTKTIADSIENKNGSRVFIHGRRGVGKSAVLASIVASARKSGHVVLYLPDGDRLRKNGFFITPNGHREGMFDLQNLSQEACSAFLASHETDLEGVDVDQETMKKYFRDSQLERIPEYSGDSIGVVALLKHAVEENKHSPKCFSAVVDTMMSQTEKKFVMVFDEFNCYYDAGHYFHISYDADVRDAIPYKKINLFEHALGAMSLTTEKSEDGEDAIPLKIQNGAIVVGITESHAVPRHITDSLTSNAEETASDDASMVVVEVPRFSDLEVDSILANFEATGIGNLRLDRGETVMNNQEVAYLRMVSGSVGQKLLDASIL